MCARGRRGLSLLLCGWAKRTEGVKADLAGEVPVKPEPAQRQRGLTQKITEGCRKRAASKAAALFPQGLQRQRNSTYEVGGLLPKQSCGLRPRQGADPAPHRIAVHHVGAV